MKIVSRKQLMEMPSGTVFSYYEPCIFRGLYIKDSDPEAGYPDFSVSDLIGAVENTSSDDYSDQCERMERGESRPTDFEMSGREGLFDDKQLFGVYEDEDKAKLAARLISPLK